jgi:uncharacterized membrane protein (UPF0127 family)
MKRIVEIINWSAPLPRPIRARYCDGFLCRLRGLMFRSRLAPDEGLLLVEKRENRLDASIHMLFVFMNLAIIWINTDGVVVDSVQARAWYPAYFPKCPARYILEVNAAHFGEFSVGDQIKIE